MRYQSLEKEALAVVFSARRLRHYFQSFTVVVMPDLPIQKVLQKPDVVMEEAQAWALVPAQQLGPWQRGFKKIGILLLMAKKCFFICSKSTTRSKAQAMRASFFICNFSIIGFI